MSRTGVTRSIVPRPTSPRLDRDLGDALRFPGTPVTKATFAIPHLQDSREPEVLSWPYSHDLRILLKIHEICYILILEVQEAIHDQSHIRGIHTRIRALPGARPPRARGYY